jgi:predicted aminopeptidase
MRIRLALLALGALAQSGCAGLGYYAQSIHGQLSLLAKRKPIAALSESPELSEEQRNTLRTVLDIRSFASEELRLPDNASYRTYAELGRPYVVWNVFATPEFSLQPKVWCFPIVGCVSYRGYFSENRAEAYAEQLRGAGFDTYVGGVRAFSTLGWFADPVLSTMLDQSPAALAAVIFHELAHQRLYLKGETGFNEAFAVTVEREGVQRWLRARDRLPALEDYRRKGVQRESFLTLIDTTRRQLTALYRQPIEAERKRQQKALILQGLQQAVARNKLLSEARDYERWLASGLNNAKLASVATYYDLVPAFQRLLAFQEDDLAAFYRASEVLATLATDERRLLLAELLESRPTELVAQDPASQENTAQPPTGVGG